MLYSRLPTLCNVDPTLNQPSDWRAFTSICTKKPSWIYKSADFRTQTGKSIRGCSEKKAEISDQRIKIKIIKIVIITIDSIKIINQLQHVENRSGKLT